MKHFATKLYVGFSDRSQGVTLGFAVPHDNLKRIGTVDGWRSKDIEPAIIENEPVEGFEFSLTKGTRYMTNREYLRVQDPRGFNLEIGLDNALDIMAENTIVNGTIEGKFVWLHENGKVLLVREDDSDYQTLLSNSNKKAKGIAVDLEVGKRYRFGNDTEGTYWGYHHVSEFVSDYRGMKITKGKKHVFSSTSNWSNAPTLVMRAAKPKTFIEIEVDKKRPVEVNPLTTSLDKSVVFNDPQKFFPLDLLLTYARQKSYLDDKNTYARHYVLEKYDIKRVGTNYEFWGQKKIDPTMSNYWNRGNNYSKYFEIEQSILDVTAEELLDAVHKKMPELIVELH